MTSSRHPKHKKPLVERPGATVELHDQLEDNDIKQIHDIFMKANKRLNSVQLRKILHSVSKITLTDEEFDVIFRRMDASGDGYVTWDEFISYLIVCYQQKEVKAGYETLENPIPTRPILLRSCHRYTVNRIAYVPTVSLLRTYNWQDGSLLTCSRDGTINYWSLDLQLERTVKSGCPNLRTQSTWVTDMVSMPDVSVVCTSSTERDLRFYDTSAKKFDLRVMFTSIDYAVSTMYYSFSKDANQESKLLLGDMGGNIHIIFIESFARGPFKSKLGLPLLEVLYSQVVKGLIEGFRVTIFQRQHTDYIRQIHFSDALHSVISCSDCSRRGLSMKDLVEGKESYVYKAPKGAWCFAYNEKNHIIACGGSDTLVRLFNCFVPSHPIAILHGHRGGIVSMILQDNAKRLYTLSQDKCIKVWDVASQSLLQNYLGLPTELGEHSDMTTLYNPESRQWIIGSTMLAAVAVSPMKNGEHTDGFTHTAGVSVVLYNPLFKNVVTCGLDSYVIVWNPWDGRKMIAIKEAHTKSVHAEVIPIEITAATFDPTFQRLITGAGDGTLKIWNFNSGTCLRNMKIQNNAEVKRIIWLKNRILAMGWNRRVTEFADSADVFGSSSDFCKNWDLRHSEDLSAAAVRVPQTLVTGTYDGEIMLWRLETGQPYKHYNVSDPTTRIKIKYKLDKKDEVKGPSAAGAAVAQGRKSVIPGLARPSTTHAIGKAAPSPAAQAASMRSRKVSMVAMPEQCLPLRKLAVHYMMFLNSRPMDPTIGTLLVSLENGSIQVWSHDIRGGFMTSFSGIHKAGDYVISMETDENNEFLFTGTSIGYIKTWLIKNYCNNRDDEHINMPKYRLMFPFMWGGFFLGRAERMAKNQFKPLLLSSFKGHVMAVSALVYINEAKILLSSSVDYTVRMWTLGGQYLQTLGTFKPWKQVYQNPQDNADFDHNVPPDICRVASSTTMRVMKGGGTLRTMSLKQLQAKVEKELTHVDQTKIYGSRLDKPILGHYYRPTMKTSEIREVQFDSTYPYIPVYQHLKMVSPSAEVQMPKQHAEHLDVKDSRRDEKKKAPP